MSRRALILGSVVGLTLVLLILFLLAGPDVAPPPEPGREPERAVREPDAPPPLTAQGGSESDAAAAPTEPREEEREDTGEPLVGRLFVVDDAGGERPAKEGRFDCGLYRSELVGFRRVEVRDGAWRVPLKPAVRLRLDSFLVEGRPAYPVGVGEWVEVPEDRRLDLRVRFPPPILLHVVADESGRDLTGLTIAGRGTRVGVDSPIEIEPSVEDLNAGVVTLSAHCAGRAWGHLRVDPRAGGERTLRLRPGGDLSIKLAGPGRDQEFSITLTALGPPPGQKDRYPGFADGVQGLEPGRYRIAAEVGDAVLGAAEFEIVPGQTTEVTLVVEARPEVTLVPLAGELIVPEAWGLEELVLDVDGIGERELPGTGGPWDLGRVEPGTYRFRVDGANYAGRIEVGPAGDANVRIEVPPPGRVELNVVDDATGKTMAIENVAWETHLTPEGTGRMEMAARDPDTGRYVFRAPQGKVDVELWDDLRQHRETIAVGSGTTRATIRVTSPTGLRLAFRTRDAPVAFDTAWEVMIEPASGEGEVIRALAGRRLLVEVDRPGRYRVGLSGLAGFEDVPEREVLVERGKVTEVEIELVPE